MSNPFKDTDDYLGDINDTLRIIAKELEKANDNSLDLITILQDVNLTLERVEEIICETNKEKIKKIDNFN